jgi:hypothetical protein
MVNCPLRKWALGVGTLTCRRHRDEDRTRHQLDQAEEEAALRGGAPTASWIKQRRKPRCVAGPLLDVVIGIGRRIHLFQRCDCPSAIMVEQGPVIGPGIGEGDSNGALRPIDVSLEWSRCAWPMWPCRGVSEAKVQSARTALVAFFAQRLAVHAHRFGGATVVAVTIRWSTPGCRRSYRDPPHQGGVSRRRP